MINIAQLFKLGTPRDVAHVLNCFVHMGMKPNSPDYEREKAKLLADREYLESWLNTVVYRKDGEDK